MTQIARAFFATILLAAFAMQPLAVARVVHFPAADPVGMLMISPPVLPGEKPPARFEPANFGWPGLGAAQGDVSVPDGRQLVLIVHPRRRPLSLLARLGPNDLDQICVITTQNEPLNFNTEVLPYIRHLSGLKGLYLFCVNLDTAGVRGLASFHALRYLYLTSMDAHPKTLGDSDLALLRKFKSLEILRLSSERITDAGMAYLGEIKSLRELSINTTNIKGPGFAELAKLPAFDVFIPSDANFDDRKLAYVKPLTNMKHLSLGNKITDAGLATIAAMKNLEGVDLHWNDRITDAGIARLAALPALKSLDVSHARITPKAAAILGKIQTLEQLNVPYLNDQMAADLRTLRNLKSLRVGTDGGLTDAGMNQLASLSNLEDVLIGGKIGDAGMVSLAKLTKLKKLFISSAPNLTNQGLASLGTIKSLTELHLPYSYGKNPKVTIGGLNQLNALTNLRLLEARNIKQDGAGLNLSALIGLEELTISMTRDSQITDRDLAGLANLRNVEKLDLRGSLQKEDVGSNVISDAGLAHFSNLVSLNQLTISGGPKLTDAGLASLAGLKRLTSIEIRGNFTDGALSRLGTMESARGLCHLSISGDFTSNGLKALEPMKMLNHLELKTGRQLDPASLKRLQASLPMMFTFNVEANRALPQPKVSAKLLKPSAAMSEPKPAGRVVHFPTDRPLGRVSISVTKEKDPIFSDLMEVAGQNGGEFEFIDHGPVKGDVFVPAGQQLQLEVNPSVDNLKDLELLGPNDVDRLSIRCPEKRPVMFESTVLPHILHLTGLKALDLMQLKIEGPGLKHLKAFPSLHTLRFFTPGSLQDADLAPLKDLKNLQVLRVTGMITDYGMPSIAQIKSLRKLYLMTTRIQGPGLAELAKHPGLDFLEIYDEKTFDDRKLSYLRGASIRHLGIGESTTRITNSGLATLHSIRNLENVDLHFNNQITDAGMENLRGLRLKTLIVRSARLTGKGAAAIYSIPTLEYLEMPNIDVTDDMFNGIGNLKNLKYIWIGGSSNSPVTDAALRQIESLSNLEMLYIGGRGITDAGMDSIARLPKLKALNLFVAPKVSDAGVAKLGKITTLTELTLPTNNSIPKNQITGTITFGGLSRLNTCTQLRKLIAEYVTHGNSTLDLSGLRNLESLRLTIEAGSTWRDEDFACLSNLPNLNWLIFGDRVNNKGVISSGVSNAGVAHLANLKSMQTLSLVGGPGLTDEGLVFLSGMNRLANIWLSGNFTDNALRRIGAMPSLRGLTGLTISGNFTSAGLQYLQPMKSLWALQIKTANHFDPVAVKQLHSKLPVVVMFGVQGDQKLPEYKTQPAVRMINPSHAFAAPQPTPAARIVHFPKDRSLGALSVQDDTIKRASKTRWYWVEEINENWTAFGEARGDVVVPAGKRLKLEVTRLGARDLSPLRRLAPGDLFMLKVEDITDGQMPYLSGLTGLKYLNLRKRPSMTPDRNWRPVSTQSLVNLEGLSIEYLETPNQITDEGLKHVAKIKTLKGLYLAENRVTDAGLANAIPQMPGLEELALSGVSDRTLAIVSRLPRLHYLLITNIRVSPNGYAALAKNPSLRIFNIFTGTVTDADFVQICNIPRLENFWCREPHITDRSIGALANAKKLKEFDWPMDHIGQSGAAALKSMPSLEILVIGGKDMTDDTMALFAGMPSLKSLRLDMTKRASDKQNLTDRGVALLCTPQSNLEELHINAPDITDKSFEYFARLPHLKSLDISQAHKVTNAGLAQLANVQTLESINFWMLDFTAAGLNKINKLPRLRDIRIQPAHYEYNEKKKFWNPKPATQEIWCDETLDLSGLVSLQKLEIPFMTDRDLASIAKLTQLKYFRLAHFPKQCCSISDAGMAHLAGLANLEDLSIDGTGLTDESLKLAGAMKKLESLYLKGNFSDAGLRQIETLNGLNTLGVQSTQGISPAAVNHLRASMPMATVFSVQGNQVFLKPKGTHSP